MGSQSPQTGQFNSYKTKILTFSTNTGECLNPLKRVNSILTHISVSVPHHILSLNPLKRVNSILTLQDEIYVYKVEYGVSIPSNGSIQFLRRQENLYTLPIRSLNPLKRVNSILTKA